MLGFRTLLIGTIILGLGIGAAFGAGMAFGRRTGPGVAAASAPAFGDGDAFAQFGQAGQAGAGGRSGGLAGTLGSIERIEGNRLTLRTPQGQVMVTLAADVAVRKTVEGSVSDLAVGQTVTATGERAGDGAITARAVQLVPEGTAGAVGGGARGGSRPGGGAGGR